MSGIPAGAGSLLGKRLGKYEIVALLALGGTAEIYLARIGGTNGFEKYVVVKCLHDHLADDTDFVKMFLDEARLAAILDHSNIVQTFELGEHEHRYFMAMEFLAGLSLAMVVRRATERLPGGLIPVPLILNIAAQACAGLHYAHERQSSGKPLNMVHRDISPQNLVISFEGVVKVVDFGIARAELRETKTKAGTIKGKFAYMSPEQCVANNVDRRTDVFALGVIVHELLTARRLFKRGSPYETYQAVIECAVDKPSAVNNQLDPALDEIVMRAVAKDKEDRYPTAEAFGDAMVGYLHHRGKPSGPGELAKFFDQHFSQEIEEHGERMRELLAGRELGHDTGANWDEEDEDAKRNATVDLGGRDSSMSLDTGDVIPMRPSEASLDEVVSGLPGEGEGEGGDEEGNAPADRTRIEANPFDKIAELDGEVAARMAAKAGLGGGAGPAPLPAPPIVAKQQPAAAVAAKPAVGAKPAAAVGAKPAAVAVAAAKPAAAAPAAAAKPVTATPPKGSPAASPGKFPDLANLPTMIAGEAGKPELAQTQIGPMVDPSYAQDAAAQGAAVGTTEAPPQADARPVGPLSATHAAQRQSSILGAINDALAAMPNTSSGKTGMFAIGEPQPPAPQQPHGQGPSPYPVMQGGRPSSGDLAPSNAPPPQYGGPQGGGQDLQHAANLMSPVGANYPNQVDWNAAAAVPARALPPWLLAVIFVLTIGAALAVTVLIAKIVHKH